MNCIIDRTIAYLTAKGEKARTIKDYIEKKYSIHIDTKAIKHRLEMMQQASSTT